MFLGMNRPFGSMQRVLDPTQLGKWWRFGTVRIITLDMSIDVQSYTVIKFFWRNLWEAAMVSKRDVTYCRLRTRTSARVANASCKSTPLKLAKHTHSDVLYNVVTDPIWNRATPSEICEWSPKCKLASETLPAQRKKEDTGSSFCMKARTQPDISEPRGYLAKPVVHATTSHKL